VRRRRGGDWRHRLLLVMLLLVVARLLLVLVVLVVLVVLAVLVVLGLGLGLGQVLLLLLVVVVLLLLRHLLLEHLPLRVACARTHRLYVPHSAHPSAGVHLAPAQHHPSPAPSQPPHSGPLHSPICSHLWCPLSGLGSE